jgi:hypothetical protein
MPRSGDTYSLPAGTAAVSNTQANSSHVNQRFDDLAAEQNAVRPISAGGTGGATAETARAALGLSIGSAVQGWDAGLASIAGLTTAADKMIYTTGADTYAVADLTAAGRALLDDANAAAQRTTLGLGTVATLASQTTITDSDSNVPTSGAVVDYAMPIAKSGSGVGQVQAISAASGTNVTLALPAGGTWAYFGWTNNTTSGVDANIVAGVAAGGTTIVGPITGQTLLAFCWRVT